MAVHSQHIRGQLVYYDSQRQRLLEAIGSNVTKWELKASDMPAVVGSTNDPRGYVITRVEAGTAASGIEASDESGFVAELVTDNLDNDGLNMQVVGKAFRLAPNRDTYFGCALQADDATQSDFLVGLCVTTTDALGAGLTDGIYFNKLDGGADINAVTRKDSSQVVSSAIHTWVANTTVTLEFYCTGLNVAFYVNGTFVSTHVANVVEDEVLTPTMQFLSGSAGVKRCKVVWARAMCLG
jgi:hypothetical protein